MKDSIFKTILLYFIVFTVFTIKIHSQNPTEKPYETKISSYMGIVHPIVTFQKGKKATYNFKDFYQVGFPTAIIIRKHIKYAYNLEFVPFIKTENGESKMSNFLFHPGVSFFGKKDFSFTPRLAFESNGRFGFSTVFSKTIIKVKNHPINFIIPVLFRFGNLQKANVTIATNIGYVF